MFALLQSEFRVKQMIPTLWACVDVVATRFVTQQMLRHDLSFRHDLSLRHDFPDSMPRLAQVLPSLACQACTKLGPMSTLPQAWLAVWAHLGPIPPQCKPILYLGRHDWAKTGPIYCPSANRIPSSLDPPALAQFQANLGST